MELTVLVFLPAAAAVLIGLLPASRAHWARYVALCASLAALALSLWLFGRFDREAGGFQFLVDERWVDVGSFELRFALGVDGLSLALVVLTTVLTTAAVLVSFSVTHRERLYYACLMVLATSVLGVFTALDALLFFLFWELELAPMYLLIAIWGSGRKEYSATKFVLYTIAGSAFMLLGILVLAFGADTFDIRTLTALEQAPDTIVPLRMVFLFLAIGFAVKLPVVPLHTWLPDAHSDAPTAVSVMLAGVLLKMGGYGIIRCCMGMLPEQAHDFAVWLAA
ncbi:MAG: NADH-quinone oxidoreductase subunit M, partial [Chloroflexota bacterium]|nr:NADH-quinone oxidoreductase subunit M [Chloroflexota bacterium]